MVGNQLLLMVKGLTKEKRRSAIFARDLQKSFREFKNLSKTEIPSCEQILSHSIEISL
jgi:hypothetical protein